MVAMTMTISQDKFAIYMHRHQIVCERSQLTSFSFGTS